MSQFAEKEAELKAKEAELGLKVRGLSAHYPDSTTVSIVSSVRSVPVMCTSVCPNAASCDTPVCLSVAVVQ
jgi:hypothetical protein